MAAQPQPPTYDPNELIFQKLEEHDCRPKGPIHQFTALCPAHDDKEASLSVGTGADGRGLVYCNTGCETSEIIKALGLKWTDLFPEDHEKWGRRSKILGKPQTPADIVLGQLIRRGILYRSTMDPHMWVTNCPVCKADDRYPLWIHEGKRNKLSLTCFNGCTQADVLRELER